MQALLVCACNQWITSKGSTRELSWIKEFVVRKVWFPIVLPTVYGMTAANPFEPSFASNWDQRLGTYLCLYYSCSWMDYVENVCFTYMYIRCAERQTAVSGLVHPHQCHVAL